VTRAEIIRPIDKGQVAHACGLITFAADYWDDALQGDFGGQRFFPDQAASGGSGAEGETSEPGGDAAGGYL
jgi:hypothetical protein